MLYRYKHIGRFLWKFWIISRETSVGEVKYALKALKNLTQNAPAGPILGNFSDIAHIFVQEKVKKKLHSILSVTRIMF